jgi:hypothetical protein
MVAGLWKLLLLRIYNYEEADEEYDGDWWNGYRLLMLFIIIIVKWQYYLFIIITWQAYLFTDWLCGGATKIVPKPVTPRNWKI